MMGRARGGASHLRVFLVDLGHPKNEYEGHRFLITLQSNMGAHAVTCGAHDHTCDCPQLMYDSMAQAVHGTACTA